MSDPIERTEEVSEAGAEIVVERIVLTPAAREALTITASRRKAERLMRWFRFRRACYRLLCRLGIHQWRGMTMPDPEHDGRQCAICGVAQGRAWMATPALDIFEHGPGRWGPWQPYEVYSDPWGPDWY